MKKHAIAIFVSGRGSNAKAIIEQQNEWNYTVSLLVVSSKKAAALELAKTHNIAFLVLDKNHFLTNDTDLLQTLNQYEVALIVLAGFLWKIPNYLVNAFSNKIMNIHPALLPKYGGKGMYGIYIHEAVFKNKESKTGITIHLVNEEYDEGEVLLQKSLNINQNDTPNSIATKVLTLEHEYYAKTIAAYLKKNYK